MLTDSFGRNHTYLRISITDNCNLRCSYCMPGENYEFTASSKLMQPDEINAIAGIFVSQGVNKIRLTGGEPLVRKDAGKIIESLSALPVELVLSTNGIRLDEFAGILKNAGVRCVNVSLDTLNADKFLLITKRDYFKKVIQNIELISKQKIEVKVNAVIMKGVNDKEINDFIEWTKEVPVHIRFIEFMPFSGNRWESQKVFGLEQILEEIGSKYSYIKLTDHPHDTSKKYKVQGHAGSFAIISTITVPFCGDCNRMRLTADGKMKNCLFSKSEVDLLSALRRGEDILPLIQQCIFSKAAERGGQLAPDFEKIDSGSIQNRSMIAIGG
jgi:cyclic pyranopterin phosphate synthase